MEYVVEIEIECPYCGEVFSSTADTSQGSHNAVEDCTVCCRPIELEINCEAGRHFFSRPFRAWPVCYWFRWLTPPANLRAALRASLRMSRKVPDSL
jgi:hypothetical protein